MMSSESLSRLALVAGLGLLCLVAPGAVVAATVPVAVSPGGVEEVLLVRQDCPTFSWSAVAGATGYELLVFALEGAEPAAESLIHELLPATSWTPAVGRCLAPGASYAWSVRALGPQGPGPWAEGRYFEVDAEGPVGRIEEAVRAVLSGLAAEGRISIEEARGLERLVREGQAAEAAVRPATGEGSPQMAPKSLENAGAAIRGQLEATSGEIYGVVGISHSPEGAGLAAKNTAGGPDLVLAGDPPALVGEAGLVRESADAVGFDFSNPGAGAMVVTVDGIPVLTEATGSTITEVVAGAGLTGGGTTGEVELEVSPSFRLPQACAGDQIASWDGSAWVCSQVGSGTITEVVAGAGLTGGGTSGAVTLDVDFAGSGSAATAARSDHGHDGVYALVDHDHDDDYAPVGHNHYGEVWSGSLSPGFRVNTNAVGGWGLQGASTATSGFGSGVFGLSLSTAGRGVLGRAAATSGTTSGVLGAADSTQGRGVYGIADATTGTTIGVMGESLSPQGRGVYGLATATSGESFGVRGQSNSTQGYGVYGEAAASTGINYGVYGLTSSTEGYAGWFQGRVHVTGDLSAGGTKPFKIDHPLDPANQYLYHFALESDEVLNFYNGNVVLDASGEAWIELPEWFAAINRDFRYQLTAIGLPGPHLHVAEEISGSRFKIGGGLPEMKVSWTVTAQRADPWVRDHAPRVEVEKAEEERGRYLYPAGYGQPEERGFQWEMREEAQQGPERVGGVGPGRRHAPGRVSP